MNDDGIILTLLIVALPFLFALAALLVMLIYNGLDLNELFNGPDMEYKQALGATFLIGMCAK